LTIFVIGSSIVSSYWNGAATYYRGIYKYLARRGHHITFAEPDAYGRQEHRDTEDFAYIESLIYRPGVDVERVLAAAAETDVVIKHSGVGADDAALNNRIPELREGSTVFFWDVDAPATIGELHARPDDPFRDAIPLYDAILTYGGGPQIKAEYYKLGALAYYSVYNGLDPETHFSMLPDPALSCDVLFVGNRLPDRETRVEALFLRAAELAPDKQFILGGEGWSDKRLPANVRWIGHVPTGDHNRINCSARMVMNINRSSMASYGFSPPTRVFECAGAGACMLCDDWPGMEECFEPDREILIIRSAEDVVYALMHHTKEDCARIGRAFQKRALRDHTYAKRAALAEHAFVTCLERRHVAATETEIRTAAIEEHA
jgi:spore maturation protein CgeB